MNVSKLDEISRSFAQRRLSRRETLVRGGAGLAAAGLGVAGLASARAQEATPAPTEAAQQDKTEFLFVQSFQSGSIVPKDGEAGTWTLTLEQGLGQTVYFSDRPERIVGAVATTSFLTGLGFSQQNPPNAALLVDTASDVDVAALELFNPRYDTATNTATYDVQSLHDRDQTLQVGATGELEDLAAIQSSFGSAHLFIDDCADGYAECYGGPNWAILGTLQTGAFCWGSLLGGCAPCINENLPNDDAVVAYWSNACNVAYADCENGCLGTIRITGSQCPIIDGVETCP